MKDFHLEFDLSRQVENEQEAYANEHLIKRRTISLMIFAAGTSIGSLFMSIFIIYLMGLINRLQIQALSALFAVRMPTNTNDIMVMIMNLASFNLFKT